MSIEDIRRGIECEKSIAIALDFDGVCKMFTEHKHQIMFTTLFLHVSEFQRVPFAEFRNSYVYIYFQHPEYAGRERFLCAWALSEYLTEKGYDCKLPGVDKAVRKLISEDRKISEVNLAEFADSEDVARMISWSHELNEKLELLNEIKLTPGIDENIFKKYRNQADYYIVSTATADSLEASLLQEGIDFIKKYYGQETATKSESLTALCQSGYKSVIMFGDSIEDSKSAKYAFDHAPDGINMFFSAVIPGKEEECFIKGNEMIEAIIQGRLDDARVIEKEQSEAFKGNEAGNGGNSNSPMTIK